MSTTSRTVRPGRTVQADRSAARLALFALAALAPALPLAGLLVGGLPGCASTRTSDVKVSYGDTARANFEKGQRELADKNYPEAIKYFSFVKTKFPFSRYATLAELRIGDAYFAQEKYSEAISAYRDFLRFRPTHAQVGDGYVAFRICEAYVKQIPGDWFLVPPSHEKDQSATREALREVTAFLNRYKRSPYLPQVEKLRRDVVRRLADHELYVARFYLERDRPKAAILRLQTVLERFPEAGMDAEVMLLLGQTYLKLDEKEKARSTFAELVQRHPGDPQSAKAKLYLRHLDRQRD